MERDREGYGGGKKQQYEFFIVIEYGFFFFHQNSVGPDETKVIRETQVGHLRAITAKRAHCLWSKADTASSGSQVQYRFLRYPTSVV